MGYNINFNGSFELDQQLTRAQEAYLRAFAETRRMKRDVTRVAALPDTERMAVGLPLGEDGEYYVGNEGNETIIDYNEPPSTQPSLWCQWVPRANGGGIEWDDGEKFYKYVKWLKYILKHFLIPWGYNVYGSVSWWGEELGDAGIITVKDNKVSVGPWVDHPNDVCINKK